MKRYIKTDENDNIVDLFFENQKSKFDGSEIFLDDVASRKDIKILDQYRSDENGVALFKYEKGKIKSRSQSEIGNDPKKIKAVDKKSEEEREALIQAKIREIAIKELEKEKKL